MSELNITVDGGMVVDVEGLPEDWVYTITDLDLCMENEEG